VCGVKGNRQGQCIGGGGDPCPPPGLLPSLLITLFLRPLLRLGLGARLRDQVAGFSVER